MLDAWSTTRDAFPRDVRDEYIEKLSDPATIHAVCEEYRAAATLDYQHDGADRGRVKINCPVLALWSDVGAVETWYEPLKVWAEWANDLRGGSIAAGHFLPEEAPDEISRELAQFFSSDVAYGNPI